MTSATDTIRAQCDQIDSQLASLGEALAAARLRDPTLLFADELSCPPLPYTAWNVDAPPYKITPQLVDGRHGVRTAISRDQPLNPQGRCKTEFGPRDTAKSTASYLRLPTDTPLKVEVELHVPQTWLRYEHKFELLAVHGDTQGKRPPLSFNLVGDRAYFWRAPQEVWTAPRPAGWSHLALEVVLSEDPLKARTKFSVDGQALFDEAGALPNSLGLPYLKCGLYCPAWSDPERLNTKPSLVAQEHVHWRRLRIWRLS